MPIIFFTRTFFLLREDPNTTPGVYDILGIYTIISNNSIGILIFIFFLIDPAFHNAVKGIFNPNTKDLDSNYG